MKRLTFEVDGRIAGQGSKNKGRGGRFYEASKYLKPWRAVVTDCAREALEGNPSFDRTAQAYRVEIVFAFQRPMRHHVACDRARPLRDDAPYYCNTKPDVDKAERAVLDALTQAGVWADDARCVSLRAVKIYTGPLARTEPGCRISVLPVVAL